MARYFSSEEYEVLCNVVRQYLEDRAPEGKSVSYSTVKTAINEGRARYQRIRLTDNFTIKDLGYRFAEWFFDSHNGNCYEGAPAQEIPQPEEQPQEVPAKAPEQVTTAYDQQDFVNPFVSVVKQQVKSEIFTELVDYCASRQRIVEVRMPEKTVQIEGIVHKVFDDVLAMVMNDIPVFLTGPAGSGKNHLCEQVAQALGLKFYFTNAVTQEYKVTGFVDAMGVFQSTEFFKAFTEGGLFMLDEMDASIPEVAIILNSALANRYFDFPSVGRITAHKDFRVIAAGNTVGTGANMQYVGRNQLDSATLDRFVFIQVDYDERVELALANNDKALVQFIHELRRASEDCGMALVFSMRAISYIAKMKQVMNLRSLMKYAIVKGLDQADIKALAGKLRAGNEYSEAFKSWVL